MSSQDADAFSTEEEAGYRELSTAAVVSLVLGLFSPLLLFGGVLIAVPLAALAVGLAALRSIAALPQARSGRGFAVVGIGLAAGSLVMVGVESSLREVLLSRQCRPTAEAWLESVRVGNLTNARALSVSLDRKPEEGGPRTLEQVWPVVAELNQLVGWNGSRLVETLDCQPERRGSWRVEQRYTPEAERGMESEAGGAFDVVLRLVRVNTGGPGGARWIVSKASRYAPDSAR